MKYYLQIRTYLTTTKLGQTVAGHIFLRYHQSLVTDAILEKIPAEIEKIMADAIVRNPRLKPMTVEVHGMRQTSEGFKVRKGTAPQIELSGGKSAFENRSAFIISAHPVELDFTDPQSAEFPKEQSTPSIR